MNKKHINQLPDQVMYRHLREKHSIMNEIPLRKSTHTYSTEKAAEIQSLKEEVTDIIFKSAHLISQLKQF